MNKQNFNQSGGFPLQTENLDQMQKAYDLFNSLGEIVGNYAIIKGCEEIAGVVNDGVVYIDGELFEFRGGNISNDVKIFETVTSLEFEDGNDKPVIHERYVTFGIGSNTIPWENFKRPKNIIQLTEEKAEKTQIDLLIERIEELEARPFANVPIGFIGIWDLPANTIPSGWVEHQPLRGRMPLGLDPNDGEFDALGTPGGNKLMTILRSFLPKFKLSVNLPANQAGVSGTGGIPFSGANNNTVNLQTEDLGDGTPMNIMNPYRIVHFIKYVG